MKYKALIIDIDGTLLNSRGEISNKTKKTLQKVANKEVEVIICTGRVFSHTAYISEQLGINNYLITSNGSFIYSLKDNKMIDDSKIDINDILSINKLIKDNMIIIYNSETETYNNKSFKINGQEIDIKDEEFFKQKDIEYIVVCCKNYEELKDLANKVELFPSLQIQDLCKSSLFNEKGEKEEYYHCDITKKGTSKGSGIKKICDYLNINLDEVIVIGDGMNDLAMFELNGPLKIAMGNAVLELKDKADIVTLTNDEDGVHYIIEELFEE